MSILEIIQLSVLALVILLIVIYIVVMAIKNKWVQKLIETTNKAIGEAEEKFGSGEGDKKKEYVIEAVKAKCKELGIPYELLHKLISKLIDTIIEHYNVIAKK